MAGTIMDRLDHVLMTFLVPLSFWASTFFIRWSSTKGPFFRERGMVPVLRSALLAGLAAADDHRVAGLVGPAGARLRFSAWRRRRAGPGRPSFPPPRRGGARGPCATPD